MELVNLTTTSYQNLNPMMLQDYVTVDACKDYVAGTVRSNYILMGCIIVLGLGILLWINRYKIPFFRRMKETKDTFGSLENIGKQFMQSMNEVKDDGRGDVSQSSNSRNDTNSDNDFSSDGKS